MSATTWGEHKAQEALMLDHERVINLLSVVGLLGFFAVVFNLETALAAVRRVTFYLTPHESTAAYAIRHRQKAHRPGPKSSVQGWHRLSD
jgi:hypothetical protein